MKDSEWLAAPDRLTLPDGTVHLWRASLDLPRDRMDRFAHLLSTDERARASRFHFDAHKDRFVVARRYLREILGRYLQTSPEDLTFEYGRHGKPALTSPMPDGRRLCFNLSHSGPLALYGFALDAEIGVDLEQLLPRSDILAVGERFFSEFEQRALRRAPDEEMLDVFYTIWTRKEAFIKALGTGLGHPLDGFSVSVGSDASNALLEVAGDADAVERWSLQGIMPAPGFVGAYCIEGCGWGLQFLNAPSFTPSC